jgi:hypothetical protein
VPGLHSHNSSSQLVGSKQGALMPTALPAAVCGAQAGAVVV